MSHKLIRTADWEQISLQWRWLFRYRRCYTHRAYHLQLGRRPWGRLLLKGLTPQGARWSDTDTRSGLCWCLALLAHKRSPVGPLNKSRIQVTITSLLMIYFKQASKKGGESLWIAWKANQLSLNVLMPRGEGSSKIVGPIRKKDTFAFLITVTSVFLLMVA